MDKKDTIKEKLINELTACLDEQPVSYWQDPLLGFADANHPYVQGLRKTVHPLHQMPCDVLEDATVVIVYFLPFAKSVPMGNSKGLISSEEWAAAYETTNALFPVINRRLSELIEGEGFKARPAPEGSVFYRDEIISRWSFRHLAYAAGLGTFGLNNMLITEKGCAGRLNGLVSDIPAKPGLPLKEEACLYKRNGSCGLCVKKCPSEALSTEGFDRKLCYEMCLENAAIYRSFGSSYSSEDDPDPGSEVCGKCLCGCPCTCSRP